MLQIDEYYGQAMNEQLCPTVSWIYSTLTFKYTVKLG